MIEATLSQSSKPEKKWMIRVTDERRAKTIHFGQAGAQDYTTHKDSRRKSQYITRHRTRERWGKDGIMTAGFWARWVLWNKPTLDQSLRDMVHRFPSLDLVVYA